MYEMKTLSQIL